MDTSSKIKHVSSFVMDGALFSDFNITQRYFWTKYFKSLVTTDW